MPFTISHAAAVLPLHKWTREQLPLAALMIGSMSPDFAYFLPGVRDRMSSHSILALFTFCWPVGLAIWLVFVRVLEQPTLALMPESWAARIVPPHREWTLKTLVFASVAVILGAVTHLLWDAITHSDTFVTNNITALNTVALEIGDARIPWYGVLQHLSTILGLVFLAIWAVGRLRSPPTPASPQHSIPSVSNKVRVIAVVLLIIATFAYAFANYLTHPYFIFEYRLFLFAIGGMTGFALAWVAIAIVISLRSRVRGG